MKKINKKIVEILENTFDNEVQKNEGILYLLSIYYNIPSFFNTEVINKVNSLKIFDKKGDKIIWNINLFGVKLTHNFIDEYNNLFKNIDITKIGNKLILVEKFTNFFNEYPEFNTKDVIEATKLYLENYINNNQTTKYLMNAENFIYKNSLEDSQLYKFLQILEENKKANNINRNNLLDLDL